MPVWLLPLIKALGLSPIQSAKVALMLVRYAPAIIRAYRQWQDAMKKLKEN
jgi:hypothetical protein